VLRGNADHCGLCAMHTFKRLNRFIRFVICVVRLEITDLTEYQDTAIGVVMSRPPAPPRATAWRCWCRAASSSTSIPALLSQVGIVHQHRRCDVAQTALRSSFSNLWPHESAAGPSQLQYPRYRNYPRARDSPMPLATLQAAEGRCLHTRYQCLHYALPCTDALSSQDEPLVHGSETFAKDVTR
jgi:hypothetical protein